MSAFETNWNIASRKFSEPVGQTEQVAIVEPSLILRFTVTYPLARPYEHEEAHQYAGWTLREFCQAVSRAYAKVYRAEGTHPGYVPGLVNRAASEGPYGIVAHDLSDLEFAGADRNEDGTWSLVVLS